MDFDWSLYAPHGLEQDEVSESFEDPFSIRLLPDARRFSTQIRFFSLGSTRLGKKIFAIYTSTGKIVKVVVAREMTPEETLFMIGRPMNDSSLPSEAKSMVTNWDDVPLFASVTDEAAYWAHHQVDIALMQRSLVATDTNESTTITLRIDPRMLSRLKRLARQRYLNYQSMLKQWVAERLEEELD